MFTELSKQNGGREKVRESQKGQNEDRGVRSLAAFE
jgi:hypothetical protein